MMEERGVATVSDGRSLRCERGVAAPPVHSADNNGGKGQVV
jgi:hypothetical protein